MKKILIVMFCLSMFLLSGCGNKKALTKDEFIDQMKDLNYSITDATEQFAGYNQVKSSTLAYNSSYQIEFYELINEEAAKSMFNTNKSNFLSEKGSSNKETNVEIGNHSKYTLTTNGQYKVVSRIDNTIVYLDVDGSYQKEVKKVLKKLGY